MTTHNEFQLIWDEAMQAARAAAKAQQVEIGNSDYAPDGSWQVTVPATTPFGKWVRDNCIEEYDFDDDRNASIVADATLTGISTEHAAVYEAGAYAAAAVFNKHLPAAGIVVDGYFDAEGLA
jgi:hypothetical protein